MQTGTEADVDEIGFFGPQMTPVDDAPRRRGRLPDHRHQGRLAAARGRHAHRPRRGAAAEPLPGYREVKPMVFCGLFPVETDQFPELRDALEKLDAERRRAHLGARDQPGARVRLPLRLPRPAPHGHRARAARARVRPRAARHDAHRRVRGHAHRRHASVVVHSPADMPDRAEIEEIREPYIRATILMPEGARRRRDGALPGAPRHARRHDLPVAGARAAPLRPAARRDRARLLRPAEVAHAAATPRSTTSCSACARPTS